MAKALKCDICGFLYEPYDGVRIVLDEDARYPDMFNELTIGCTTSKGSYRKDLDCCPGCMKDIKELIEERRGN